MDNNQYIFHEDPGHGWLEVPIETIKDLNLIDRITPYSYIDAHSVYLEEDCDLTTFVRALKKSGTTFNFDKDCIVNYQDDTPIRRMRSYDPAALRNRY